MKTNLRLMLTAWMLLTATICFASNGFTKTNNMPGKKLPPTGYTVRTHVHYVGLVTLGSVTYRHYEFFADVVEQGTTTVYQHTNTFQYILNLKNINNTPSGFGFNFYYGDFTSNVVNILADHDLTMADYVSSSVSPSTINGLPVNVSSSVIYY